MPLPLPFLPRQFPKPQGHLMVNRLSPRLFIALGTGLLRLHFITLWLTYEAKANLCINKQSIISRLLTYCQDRKLPSHLTTNIFLLIDIGGPMCGPSTLSLSSVGSKINHSLHKNAFDTCTSTYGAEEQHESRMQCWIDYLAAYIWEGRVSRIYSEMPD